MKTSTISFDNKKNDEMEIAIRREAERQKRENDAMVKTYLKVMGIEKEEKRNEN